MRPAGLGLGTLVLEVIVNDQLSLKEHIMLVYKKLKQFFLCNSKNQTKSK